MFEKSKAKFDFLFGFKAIKKIKMKISDEIQGDSDARDLFGNNGSENVCYVYGKHLYLAKKM